MTAPHHPPDRRRRCHRRRIRRHLRRPQAAQRTRPHHGRFRQGRRPRRHLVLEPLPGRTVGHREPPLPLLLRPRPAAGQHLEEHLHHPARDSRIPGRRRRPFRPAPPLPLRHRGHVRHLLRRRGSVGGHHRRRRRVSRHLCHQRGRTALRHQLPEPARPGHVRGRDHPHRRLARGQGPHGSPRRRHRHRFHRPAGDHRPGAEGRAADRFRPDPAVFGPGRQPPRDRHRTSTR